jgi:hypothetical protein
MRVLEARAFNGVGVRVSPRVFILGKDPNMFVRKRAVDRLKEDI